VQGPLEDEEELLVDDDELLLELELLVELEVEPPVEVDPLAEVDPPDEMLELACPDEDAEPVPEDELAPELELVAKLELEPASPDEDPEPEPEPEEDAESPPPWPDEAPESPPPTVDNPKSDLGPQAATRMVATVRGRTRGTLIATNPSSPADIRNDAARPPPKQGRDPHPQQSSRKRSFPRERPTARRLSTPKARLSRGGHACIPPD
jgi:hypothetical protein